MTPHQRATRALALMLHQDGGEHDGPHRPERCLACQVHKAVVREIEEAEAEIEKSKAEFEAEVVRLRMELEAAPLPPKPAKEMTATEKAELERLYEQFTRRRAEDGGEWPEYIGPGR